MAAGADQYSDRPSCRRPEKYEFDLTAQTRGICGRDQELSESSDYVPDKAHCRPQLNVNDTPPPRVYHADHVAPRAAPPPVSNRPRGAESGGTQRSIWMSVSLPPYGSKFFQIPGIAEMNDSQPELIEIYRAQNLSDAHLIRMALEDAGIRVRIDGELLQGLIGSLPLGWNSAPRVMVEESQAAVAREIIQRTDVRNRAGADEVENDSKEVTRCLACGRVIEESEVQCSACGWTFAREGVEVEPDDA